MPTPHARFAEFFETLKDGALLVPKECDVYRQSAPNWMSLAYRLTGVGAVLTGGRWNVQKVMPAVYATADPDTMHAEAYAKAHAYGWTKADLKPQAIVSMKWKLQAVLDLTDDAVLSALKVRKEELMDCDWRQNQAGGKEPITQAVARAAFERLAEGVVAPSARHTGGINVVLFPSNRREGSLVTTHHEDEIPFMHGLK